MAAVTCALGAALLYALATVLQHRAARRQPQSGLRWGLLGRLAREPAWVAGLACDAGAYGLQFVALGHGPVVVVQLLLVCGLLFALPLGAAWSSRRLTSRDWSGAVLVCGGLAVFLPVAHPGAGHPGAPGWRWAVLLVAASAGAGSLAAAGSRGGPRRRALCLASGAGLVYGVAAALTKSVAHQLGGDPAGLVAHWQLYALAAAAAAGMLLAQAAFQAGALDLSLPALSVVDPLASVAIGSAVLGESMAAGPAAVLVEVVSLGAMVAGVAMLAASGQREQSSTTLPNFEPAAKRS